MSTNYDFDVDQARETLREAGYLVDVLWSKDDIRGHAKGLNMEITEEQVDEVADLLQRKFNAEFGINRFIIELRIREVMYRGSR